MLQLVAEAFIIYEKFLLATFFTEKSVHKQPLTEIVWPGYSMGAMLQPVFWNKKEVLIMLSTASP